MASFWMKFQIFGPLLLDKNKYNLFLRQQAWHCARPTLCSKKNLNEDHYDNESPLATSKVSERYGKRKKMSFLNFRRTSSTKAEERSRINNCKTQKLPERKLTFWEYVFGPKKSLLDSYQPIHRQRQARRKENPLLCDPRYQAMIRHVMICGKPVKSSKNSRNLEPQSLPMQYKMPRAVLLNKMIMDGFDENNSNCNDKTITFTTARKPYEEMRPPLSFRKAIELRRDVTSENNEKSMLQISTQISAIEAYDSTAKIRKDTRQEQPRKRSRIEQLETLVNEKISKFKHITNKSKL